jgi:hypothetical protein
LALGTSGGYAIGLRCSRSKRTRRVIQTETCPHDSSSAGDPPISPLRDGLEAQHNIPLSDFNKLLPAIPFPSPPILLHAPQPRRPLLVELPVSIVGSREPSPSPSITPPPQTPTTPPPIHDSPTPDGRALASSSPPPPRPRLMASASRPRKFGGTGSCPACGILVSPLERGTIAGPRGTRWHAKCLRCGSGPMGAIKTHRPGHKRAGCGKALDDGASLDEQGNAWCRLCFVSDYAVYRLFTYCILAGAEAAHSWNGTPMPDGSSQSGILVRQ